MPHLQSRRSSAGGGLGAKRTVSSHSLFATSSNASNGNEDTDLRPSDRHRASSRCPSSKVAAGGGGGSSAACRRIDTNSGGLRQDHIAAFYHSPSTARRLVNDWASPTSQATTTASGKGSGSAFSPMNSSKMRQNLNSNRGGGASLAIGITTPPPQHHQQAPLLLPTEEDLSGVQRRRLQALYAAYLQQVAEKGPLEWEVVADLVAKVDSSLLDKNGQMARLRKCGFNPLKCPVMPYSVLANYALRSPSMCEPPLPKDEQETVDAFVYLGGNRDRSGFITTDTLRGILENFKMLLDVQALLNEVDTDGSGTIEYDEFEAFYLKKKRMADSARAAATSASSDRRGSAGEEDEEVDDDDGDDGDDMNSVITRTLSMNSVEAFEMLSKMLLNGDGEFAEELEWQVRGAYAERLRQQESQDKYVLEDDDDDDRPIVDVLGAHQSPASPIGGPSHGIMRASTPQQMNNHHNHAPQMTPQASVTFDFAGVGGSEANPTHPAAAGNSSPFSATLNNNSSFGGAMGGLSLSFAASSAGGGSFAGSTMMGGGGGGGPGVSFSSPLGTSMRSVGSGRRARAGTVRREKTAAALLNDALNSALDAHRNKLRDVTTKHRHATGHTEHFAYHSEVDHVSELAVASIERERRRSTAAERQRDLFNDRVELKRGSKDFGVTPIPPVGGAPVRPPSAAVSRPQSATASSSSAQQQRRASAPVAFGSQPPPPRPLSTSTSTRRAPLQPSDPNKPLPHYAMPIASATPSGVGTASLMALMRARVASEEAKLREKELRRKVKSAERRIDALDKVLHPEKKERTNASDDDDDGRGSEAGSYEHQRTHNPSASASRPTSASYSRGSHPPTLPPRRQQQQQQQSGTSKDATAAGSPMGGTRAYEDEIAEDDGDSSSSTSSDAEPSRDSGVADASVEPASAAKKDGEEGTTAAGANAVGRPLFKDLVASSAAGGGRPTTAPTAGRFSSHHRPTTPSSASRPTSAAHRGGGAHQRPSTRSDDRLYDEQPQRVSAFAGRDFYSIFCATAPLSARRRAAASDSNKGPDAHSQPTAAVKVPSKPTSRPPSAAPKRKM